MQAKFVAAAMFLAAGVCLADATVEQRTQIHFGGALGAVMNVFSRDSAKEGVTSGSVVKGNRMLTRSGSTGEIVDLGEEKVYRLDFDRKAYTVKTFDELRREFEEGQERARKNAAKQTKSTKSEKSEGPEYDVEFDTRATGEKETINGWNTREQIVTITVHEKGKKLEESGGVVLTADMWVGPKIAAYREIADFQQRFAQKIYGPAFASDMRQMAAAMAMTPAFGKAMKAFNEKGKSIEGTPIRTKMTFDTVSGSSQQQQNQQQTERDTSPQAAAIGGLLGRMKERRQKQQAESGQSTSLNRSTFLESNSELLTANNSASAADVALPSGFKQR
jgi:hypothetical protein